MRIFIMAYLLLIAKNLEIYTPREPIQYILVGFIVIGWFLAMIEDFKEFTR